MSKLKVLDKKVLVVPPPKDNKTVGGFITPTTSNNVGIVLGMGKNLDPNQCGFVVGSKVLYGSKHEQVEIDNQKVFLMEVENIFGVQED